MQQENQQLNIDIEKAEDVGCKECGNLYFSPVLMIKRLSALLSPTGKELKFPVHALQCIKCQEIEVPHSEE